MYFASPIQSTSTICALLACAFALWRGGGRSGLAAVLILVDWFVTPLIPGAAELRAHADGRLPARRDPDPRLLAIALRADRFWPMWVVAFQALELLMHVAMLVDRHVHARAYFIGIEITSYMILLALMIGTWLGAPRRGRRGPRGGSPRRDAGAPSGSRSQPDCAPVMGLSHGLFIAPRP